MGKTQAYVQDLIAQADENLAGAAGRIKTILELAEHTGETLHFVVCEASFDRIYGGYLPSMVTRRHTRRLDYFLKKNSGGAYKNFYPTQEIFGAGPVYIFEHGDEDSDYPMWCGVNVMLYNVPFTDNMHRWNAVFTNERDAENYRLWCRMAHDHNKGWESWIARDPRYTGIIEIDRRQIMTRNRMKTG